MLLVFIFFLEVPINVLTLFQLRRDKSSAQQILDECCMSPHIGEMNKDRFYPWGVNHLVVFSIEKALLLRMIMAIEISVGWIEALHQDCVREDSVINGACFLAWLSKFGIPRITWFKEKTDFFMLWHTGTSYTHTTHTVEGEIVFWPPGTTAPVYLPQIDR